jgi:hypothetical protein
MLKRFRRRFVIEITNRRADLTQGRAPVGFVPAVTDIARRHGIDKGLIECVGTGRDTRLKFSKGIPERARQAIRNAWTPPPTPGSGTQRARG